MGNTYNEIINENKTSNCEQRLIKIWHWYSIYRKYQKPKLIVNISELFSNMKIKLKQNIKIIELICYAHASIVFIDFIILSLWKVVCVIKHILQNCHEVIKLNLFKSQIQWSCFGSALMIHFYVSISHILKFSNE